MTFSRLVLTASLFASASICAYSDALIGNGSWTAWNPTVLNTSSTVSLGATPAGPYWNGASGDGANYNIGWCMTGTGSCHISNPPGALSYYGNGTAAASNMYFAGTGTQEVSLLGLFSIQNGVLPAGTDYFGWYSVNSNGTVGTMTQLLSSTQAIGSTASFTPTGNYGFYLENVQLAGAPFTASYYWFSNDSNNFSSGSGAAPVDADQHFSIFGSAASSTYYLGLEDTQAASADFDYNDMVIELQPAPEPASLVLMAGGMGLLALAIRRRRA